MRLSDLKTIADLQAFLLGTQAVMFTLGNNKDEAYRIIQGELVRFSYATLKRQDKGVVIQYLIAISGYSRQQITRLISQYVQTGKVVRSQRTAAGFATKYTDKDIRLLAQMDTRHDSPCGHVIKKLCERACEVYGEQEYTNLATISVSHLYNLRHSSTYTNQRRHFEKTRPKASNIGERRKPQAEGLPGYIRIDTVHQGDQDKIKGVYHINAVDEVTQYEVVCTVEKISEHYLIPALKQILDCFPFTLRGFHSDNGSEYVNKRVADLLNKLHIEFTKSRSRHSNDNALAESKNASVVRKIFGYAHISQAWAPEINLFNQEHLVPYINYHRPCFYPEIEVDQKGKERKKYHYRDMMTPYEKLKTLPEAESYLKTDTTFEILDAIAYEMSDNQAAEQLQKARQSLFKRIHEATPLAG